MGRGRRRRAGCRGYCSSIGKERMDGEKFPGESLGGTIILFGYTDVMHAVGLVQIVWHTQHSGRSLSDFRKVLRCPLCRPFE